MTRSKRVQGKGNGATCEWWRSSGSQLGLGGHHTNTTFLAWMADGRGREVAWTDDHRQGLKNRHLKEQPKNFKTSKTTHITGFTQKTIYQWEFLWEVFSKELQLPIMLGPGVSLCDMVKLNHHIPCHCGWGWSPLHHHSEQHMTRPELCKGSSYWTT